jgi:hypothetical protein
MKLQTIKDTTEKSGQINSRKCKVDINEVTFKALTSNLYTNKALAIVRELSTNAYDAHVDNNNVLKPFDVQLPNVISPMFKIRDYGLGLSYEGIHTTYTFFASNRRESNNHIGAWGLGAFAPHSYVDSFAVTSYYEGRRYEYTILREKGECVVVCMNGKMGEDGEMILTSFPETDEPSGLEISVPTEVHDAEKFAVSAEKVYEYFSVRPNIVGANVEFDQYEPLIEGDGYQLFNEKLGSTEILVVMGQVCYAAKASELTSSPIAYGSSIRLFVENGSCSFNLGREELQYDEQTVETIQAALDEAVKDAEEQILATLDTSMSKIERAIAVAEYKEVLNGLQIDGLSRINTEEKDIYSLRGFRLEKAYGSKPDRLMMSVYIGRSCKGGSYIAPRAGTQYFFIEDDVEEVTQKWKMRLKYYLQQQSNPCNTNCYFVTVEDRVKAEEAFGPITIKVSELPKVPRQSRTYSGSGGTRSHIHNFYAATTLKDSWSPCEEPIKEDGCAIQKKGYRPMWRGEWVEPIRLQGIAEVIGFKNTYGIAPKSYDKLRKEHELPDLETAAKEYVEKYLKGATDLEVAGLLSPSYNVSLSFKTSLLEKIKGLSTECDNLRLIGAKIPYADALAGLIRTFDLVPKDLPKVDFKEKFYKKYPLIKEIGCYYYDTESMEANIIQYIKLIEGK